MVYTYVKYIDWVSKAYNVLFVYVYGIVERDNLNFVVFFLLFFIILFYFTYLAQTHNAHRYTHNMHDDGLYFPSYGNLCRII